MTQEETDTKQSKKGRLIRFSEKHNFKPKKVLIVFIALIVLFTFLSSGLVYFGIISLTTVKSKTVSLGLKNVGELATQAGYFTSVQLITGSRQVLGVEIPLTQSKFVYSYDGIIKAGLDFEAIEVNIDDALKTITIRLPEVKILSIEIDEKSFEIFDESNNIFNPLGLNDVNISLIELKNEARENAISNGLLENARTNAQTLIKGFLAGSFDLQVYSIVFV